MCLLNNFKDQFDFEMKNLDTTKKILDMKLHRGGSFCKLYICHKENIFEKILKHLIFKTAS